MKTADIKNGAATWAQACVDSAVTVYYARQPQQNDSSESSPFPGRPALAVQMGTADQIGEDKKRMAGPDSTVLEFIGVRTQTILFRAFGDTDNQAQDIVESLRQGMRAPTKRWVLRDQNLVVNSIQGSIDQSEGLGAKWENRAQLDIEFRYTIRYTDEPGVIEVVPFDGTFEDNQGNTRTSTVTHDRS